MCSTKETAVKPVLQWIFDKNIVSTLTEEQHHTKNDADSTLSETALRFEFKKFKYFVTEQVLTAREKQWIEM